ncbi:hypothetical protein PF005_g11828 [Phytophthora fragariae]|uniref:Major facilitator superfamily (MFS) profile domain-containing protein n=6 Tax=Phytophthora fragariae TaxID=53985 RepID=A0A6A3TZ56_9STRA|nr:hypothetical protein PF003_g24350 [Phytophthora fragariae]KAE8937060.1 hypothetical protein PF009_g13017 [Phytophthora fragariae]KAE9005632.1 hypothetical protein PF011_g11955 [Phytophthora fragariae]KAE9105835.1 hypothetical protein PF010_g12847 [Phytophthora fragariae]KAE9107027.1 hypothetical protein PF007_g13182 [Phytophthora fragariae]
MASPGELLVHVRQRLDALTYDDHSQYLLSSLQASPFVQSLSVPTTSTSRRRSTLLGSWLRYVGLTRFYVRLVLLLGTGWLLAMVGIFTFLYALPAAQEDIVLTSTAQVILLLGIYFLGGAVGCLAFGVCADHFGRRPVLLSALSFWLVVNALTAGAWNYASFVTLRLLAGMGIGGQLALLSTLALEYTPTRTRGRITALTVSMAGLGVLGGVGYGQLACSALGQGGLGWRTAYGVLSAIALLFAAVLYLALEESPKYLASVGRTQEALYVLEKIEAAHGINRQARVTVPTSLYEPLSQRPHVSYERYLESSSDSDSDLDLDLDLRCSGQEEEIQRDMRARAASRSNRYSYAGPGAAKARSQSQRASARRLPSRHQRQFEVCTPSSGDLGTPSDTLAPTADTSFLRSLARRVVALFSGSLARRTALIWFFWFAECTCLSAAIVTTLMMAGTFVKVNALGTGFEVGDQLFWAAMTFPGLLLAATMVETVGRRGTLAVFVFGAGAVMVISAWLLEEDGEWLGLLLSLGALVLTTGGTIGSMIPFTGEQFPLLTRALGISCAAGWGHLGMFAGAYLVLRRVMGDEAWTWHDERLMLVVCGAVSIILIPLILFMGPETRGRDIDASWFEDNKALHALAGGVLSAAPGGRPDQPASRCRGVGKASIGRGSKKLSKASESSDGDDHELPESPFGRGSMNGRTLAAPVIYSPNSAALAAAHSPGEYESSCSSSSSSGFWQTHSVRHLSHKMKRAAQAIAHTSDEKHAVYLPSEGKLRARSTSGAKQTRNVDDRCDTVIDDLDQLETIVTEHEYRQHRLSVDDPKESQPRRQSLLELLEHVLLEWRRSISSSLSGSARDLSGSSKAEHSASTSTDMQSAITASDVRSSATGRYTIDLDMFDTFTYISTPVLGGDNYEHREPSNLSSVSSGDTKQTSS